MEPALFPIIRLPLVIRVDVAALFVVIEKIFAVQKSQGNDARAVIDGNHQMDEMVLHINTTAELLV